MSAVNTSKELPELYRDIANRLDINLMLGEIRYALTTSLSRPGLINKELTTELLSKLCGASSKTGDKQVFDVYTSVIGNTYLQSLLKAPIGSDKLLEYLLVAFSQSFAAKARKDNLFKTRLGSYPATTLWEVQNNFLLWIEDGKDRFCDDSEMEIIGKLDHMEQQSRLSLGVGIVVATESMSVTFARFLGSN